jgi:hypothetical protein
MMGVISRVIKRSMTNKIAYQLQSKAEEKEKQT